LAGFFEDTWHGHVESLAFDSIFWLVTPIGALRRFFGKDSLKLRAFKASEESVMIVRNHLFVARDIEKPY